MMTKTKGSTKMQTISYDSNNPTQISNLQLNMHDLFKRIIHPRSYNMVFENISSNVAFYYNGIQEEENNKETIYLLDIFELFSYVKTDINLAMEKYILRSKDVSYKFRNLMIYSSCFDNDRTLYLNDTNGIIHTIDSVTLKVNTIGFFLHARNKMISVFNNKVFCIGAHTKRKYKWHNIIRHGLRDNAFNGYYPNFGAEFEDDTNYMWIYTMETVVVDKILLKMEERLNHIFRKVNDEYYLAGLGENNLCTHSLFDIHLYSLLDYSCRSVQTNMGSPSSMRMVNTILYNDESNGLIYIYGGKFSDQNTNINYGVKMIFKIFKIKNTLSLLSPCNNMSILLMPNKTNYITNVSSKDYEKIKLLKYSCHPLYSANIEILIPIHRHLFRLSGFSKSFVILVEKIYKMLIQNPVDPTPKSKYITLFNKLSQNDKEKEHTKSMTTSNQFQERLVKDNARMQNVREKTGKLLDLISPTYKSSIATFHSSTEKSSTRNPKPDYFDFDNKKTPKYIKTNLLSERVSNSMYTDICNLTTKNTLPNHGVHKENDLYNRDRGANNNFRMDYHIGVLISKYTMQEVLCNLDTPEHKNREVRRYLSANQLSPDSVHYLVRLELKASVKLPYFSTKLDTGDFLVAEQDSMDRVKLLIGKNIADKSVYFKLSSVNKSIVAEDVIIM